MRLQPARELSRCSSATAGRRRASSISTLSRAIHLDRLTPLAGARRDARARSARTGSSSASSATRPAPCCGARPSISAGRRYFGRLVGAGDAARRQARMPRRCMLALDGSGIAPATEVWFVGDTALDMECAHNSRLHRRFCSATRGRPSESSPASRRALSFADCGGLFRFVAGACDFRADAAHLR